MKKLMKYFKPHYKYVLLAPLFMLIEVMCDLQMPKLMSSIVDVGIGNNDISYIVKIGGLMLVLALIGAIGGISCGIFASKASQYVGADIRAAMFERIQQFSFVNLDKFQTSSLIVRLTNDVTQVQQIILMALRALVRSPLIFAGSIYMVVSTNKELSKILFVSLPIMCVAVFATLKFAFPLFALVQKKVDRVNNVMRENLTGVRVVKAFVRAEFENEKFKVANEESRDINIQAFKIMSLMMPIVMFVMNATIVAVIWFGGLQVGRGSLLTGDIIAFINYITQILMSFMMASMVIMGISRGKASVDRINEVLDTETDIHSPENPTPVKNAKGRIEFNHVSFSYPGSDGDPVLSDVNFVIQPGQTVGIMGQTGAGKSTLVNLIPRLYETTGGKVLIDGVDVRERDLQELRLEIGMVPQQSVLFSGSITDNLKWGKENATEQEVLTALDIAQASDFIEKLPEKSSTILGQMGVNLSGGQKQRLSIARALIKKPSIIIFDDSTSAVDMATEAKIKKGLAEYMPDCTKIIIAQRVSSVANADIIIVLAGGEVAALGSHEELIHSSVIYKEIYYSQNEGVLLDE